MRERREYGIPPLSNSVAGLVGTIFGRKLAETEQNARIAVRAMADHPDAFNPVRAYVVASSQHEELVLRVGSFRRNAVPAAERLDRFNEEQSK
jgi:hypothetical protein